MSPTKTQNDSIQYASHRREIKKPIFQLAANSSLQNEIFKTAENFASKYTATVTEQEWKS